MTGYSHRESWHGDVGVRASGGVGENVCDAFYQPMKTDCFLSLHANDLSPSLLAICMIPKLLDTAHKHSVIPRLVIVASYMHCETMVDTLVPNVHDTLIGLDAN